ncbi:MAG: hypothetical protein ACOCRK_12065 [bacterium]
MKIQNTKVYGLHENIKRSGIPMSLDIDRLDINYDRARNLARNKPGTGHNCYLKGIIVQADITATIKWWVQWGRYHFADIISSQSTMHKIKDMNLNKVYNKYVDDRVIEIMEELQEQYNENPTKENFYKLVYTNPDGLELTAGITTNYLQEKTIYLQRRNHKLKYEWGKYCDWIENLPHSDLIIDNGNVKQELLDQIDNILNNIRHGNKESVNNAIKKLENLYDKYA